MGSRSADTGALCAVLGFPKGWGRLYGAIARLGGVALRPPGFPALSVSVSTRVEYKGDGRRLDHGATTGRAILPVRGAGRG